MNPGLIDLPATYAAPLTVAADAPRVGRSGAASAAFSAPVKLWVGRLTPPSSVNSSDTGGGQRNTANTTFLARWSHLFSEGGRLVVEGRSYDLMTTLAAPNTPRRSWLHLTCRHVTGVNPAIAPVTAFT